MTPRTSRQSSRIVSYWAADEAQKAFAAAKPEGIHGRVQRVVAARLWHRRVFAALGVAAFKSFAALGVAAFKSFAALGVAAFCRI